jgi:hypothetical protein
MPDITPYKHTSTQVRELLEMLHKSDKPFRIKFYRNGALKRITAYEKKW